MTYFDKVKNRLIRTNLKAAYYENLEKTIPNFKILYDDTTVVINDKCSELEVNTNRISSFLIKDVLPTVGFSPYPLTEQILMTSAVTTFKPDYIFEWGTHLGISARIFHEICKKYNIETVIHSIDLPDDVEHIEHPKNNRGIKVRGIENVKLHQGDGLDKSFEIIGKLNSNPNLLFFLDGDHEYESVYREIEGIHSNFPKANILAHDTFYQSEESKYNIGPFQAIKDFTINYPNSYKILSTNFGLPGMTLLYNKNA